MNYSTQLYGPHFGERLRLLQHSDDGLALQTRRIAKPPQDRLHQYSDIRAHQFLAIPVDADSFCAPSPSLIVARKALAFETLAVLAWSYL